MQVSPYSATFKVTPAAPCDDVERITFPTQHKVPTSLPQCGSSTTKQMILTLGNQTNAYA